MPDSKIQVFDRRTRAFVDHIDSIVESTESGGRKVSTTKYMTRMFGDNFIFNKSYIIPENVDVNELNLFELKCLSFYLSDAIIMPSAASTTTWDHFNYWAWTAAVASQMGIHTKTDMDITDFQYSVHLGLLPIRVARPRQNPTLDAVITDNERLLLLSALTVLEGLICNIGDILTEEGIAKTQIAATWKPRDENGDLRYINNGSQVHNYHDILQIWKEYEASRLASIVLKYINNLKRYRQDSLRSKFENSIGIINEEISDETYNFLRIIGKNRNFNLHGQISTRS
jgi:hypothetical protein